jgi:hypothetical protein
MPASDSRATPLNPYPSNIIHKPQGRDTMTSHQHCLPGVWMTGLVILLTYQRAAGFLALRL